MGNPGTAASVSVSSEETAGLKRVKGTHIPTIPGPLSPPPVTPRSPPSVNVLQVFPPVVSPKTPSGVGPQPPLLAIPKLQHQQTVLSFNMAP